MTGWQSVNFRPGPTIKSVLPVAGTVLERFWNGSGTVPVMDTTPLGTDLSGGLRLFPTKNLPEGGLDAHGAHRQ